MKLVRVRYHGEPEGWWADSQDVPEWTAGGQTIEECREQVFESLAFLFEDESFAIEEIGRPGMADIEILVGMAMVFRDVSQGTASPVTINATRYIGGVIEPVRPNISPQEKQPA